MQLGMIGLGRMGGNMVRRLLRDGHQCVVYDRSAETVAALAGEGAVGAASLAELVDKLAPPRAIFMMLPAAFVGATVTELAPRLAKDDVLVDGGNSHYHDDIARSRALGDAQVHYLDMGTSGGVWGLERGYCLMIGGDTGAVQRLDAIFRTLAPGRGDVPPSPGREGRGGTADLGYLHCGPSGSPPGCSTSPPPPSPRARTSTTSPGAWPTPARGGGRSTRPSTSRCPRTCSPRRSSSASPRAARTTSRTA
jgi:6-phosphogluconate dehydrogenase